MTAIKFKKEFYPLIRDGIKTQTLRILLLKIYPDTPNRGRLYYHRFRVEGVTERVKEK